MSGSILVNDGETRSCECVLGVLPTRWKLFLEMETHARFLVNEMEARSWNGRRMLGFLSTRWKLVLEIETHARFLVNEMTTLDLFKERNADSVHLEHAVSLGNLSIENWSRATVNIRARGDAPPWWGTRTARW